MSPSMSSINRTAAIAVAIALAASGCGSDDDTSSSDTSSGETTSSETSAPAPGTDASDDTGDPGDPGEASTITIGGIDYGFEDVPETTTPGTRLLFDNTSDVELHELVAFRVDTDDPLDDLLVLPQPELEQILGAPTAVLVQPPGAPEAFAAVGDGTLSEPGRYILLCTIPVGADPEAYLAATQAAGGSRPEGFDGPPHFTAGMAAELTVE